MNTDVLILSLSIFHKLKEYLEELWIDFEIGKNRRFLHVHEMYQHLGEEKALALPFFHAFTGCNQVSFMSFVSRNTAWKIRNFFDQATPIFMKLSDHPTIEDVKKAMPTINRLPYFCTIRHLIPRNFKTENIRLIGPSYQKRLLQSEI